ncbi:hypothetical protein HQN86_23230 [Pedobacter panaciterrae]|jgi:hypothetical protein|uniref:hypothetical protein n=1 Tax=Pedobacter panaciterrae TaxID=363849 RepID=UPI00155DD46F|nr:hypothetical protein [Pedobacter panaciterrae]NQX56551.1 hypothetical protein [Pedobacter panaciterrae]
MTTLTVNIDNKKSEKAVKAVLEALGLDYSVASNSEKVLRPLNKTEQNIYNNLVRSFEQIKLHQEGKIKLQDAKAAILEIEAELDQ